MKRFALICALGAFAVAVAPAQETKPVGVSVKGGFFFPSKKSAREAGSNWFVLGADYKLKDLKYASGPDGMSTSLSLSVDYASKGDFRSVPVLVNYVSRRNEMYYFAGIGMGFLKGPTTGNESRMAYQLGVGYDFQRGANSMFVEGRWLGSARDEVSGFAVTIGIRL